MRVSIFSPERVDHHSICCKFKKYLEEQPDLNMSEANYTFKSLSLYVRTGDELDFLSLCGALKNDPFNLTQCYLRLKTKELQDEVQKTHLEFRDYCLNYKDTRAESTRGFFSPP